MLCPAFCASIALTGPYGPDSSLRRHNVLSETQQFGPCCTRINRCGGAVSNFDTPPEVRPAMLRHFDQDMGSRRDGPSTPIPDAPTKVVGQFTINLGGRRDSPGTALSTSAAEAQFFSKFTTDVSGRWHSSGSPVSTQAHKQHVPTRLSNRYSKQEEGAQRLPLASML